MAKQATSGTAKLLQLQPQDATPLYRQLYERLRLAILTGQLKAGAQLPSTRTLASELAVSRNTVLLAYEQLLAEGYVDGKVGSGTTVARILPETLLSTLDADDLPTAPSTSQQSIWAKLSQRGRILANTPFIPKPLLTPEGRQQKAFRVGMPAYDALPYEIWAQLIARRARYSLSQLLSYRNPAGYYPLREAIAAHLVNQLASQQAAAVGVDVLPLSLFSIQPSKRGGLLLGYAATNEQEIQDSERQLAKALLASESP